MEPIIIDNFLTKKEYKNVYTEIKLLAPEAEDFKRPTCDCKTHLIGTSTTSKPKPQFFYDIWSRVKDIVQRNEHIDSTFRLMKFEHIFSLLIRWRDSNDSVDNTYHNDMASHPDNPTSWDGHIIHFILYFNPRKTWSGGTLGYKNENGEFEIEAKDNRLVIIPAGLEYRINPIKVKGTNIMDSRISLNGEIII